MTYILYTFVGLMLIQPIYSRCYISEVLFQILTLVYLRYTFNSNETKTGQTGTNEALQSIPIL